MFNNKQKTIKESLEVDPADGQFKLIDQAKTYDQGKEYFIEITGQYRDIFTDDIKLLEMLQKKVSNKREALDYKEFSFRKGRDLSQREIINLIKASKAKRYKFLKDILVEFQQFHEVMEYVSYNGFENDELAKMLLNSLISNAEKEDFLEDLTLFARCEEIEINNIILDNIYNHLLIKVEHLSIEKKNFQKVFAKFFPSYSDNLFHFPLGELGNSLDFSTREVEESGSDEAELWFDDDHTDFGSLDESAEYSEGKEFYTFHRSRERVPKLVRDAKKLFKQKNGSLFCEACGIDFEKMYGERGQNFIEAHHTKPVSEMKEGETTKLEDIVMLCSNCHRMVHKKPFVTVEQLRNIIKSRE